MSKLNLKLQSTISSGESDASQAKNANNNNNNNATTAPRLDDQEPLSIQILSQLFEVEQKTVHKLGRVVELFHKRVVELFHKPLSEKGRGVLSFAQHWALFSNLATLHESQTNVLNALGNIISSLRAERMKVMEHKKHILMLQLRIAKRKALQQQQQQHQTSLSQNEASQLSNGSAFAKSRNPPKIATHHRHVSSTGSAVGPSGPLLTGGGNNNSATNPIRSPTTSRLGQMRSAAASSSGAHTQSNHSAAAAPPILVMSNQGGFEQTTEPQPTTMTKESHVDPLNLTAEMSLAPSNLFSPNSTMHSDVTPIHVHHHHHHHPDQHDKEEVNKRSHSQSPQGPLDPSLAAVGVGDSLSTSPTVFGSPVHAPSLGNTVGGGVEGWHSRGVSTGDDGDDLLPTTTHAAPSENPLGVVNDGELHHPLLCSGPDGEPLETVVSIPGDVESELSLEKGGVEHSMNDADSGSHHLNAKNEPTLANDASNSVDHHSIVDADDEEDSQNLLQLLAEAEANGDNDESAEGGFEDHVDSAEVLALFRGTAMMHFLAEHMMYTLQLCRSIMPTLCTLIDGVRVLRSQHQMQTSLLSSMRFGFGGAAGGGGGGAATNQQQTATANIKGNAPLLPAAAAAAFDMSTSSRLFPGNGNPSESPRKSSIVGASAASGGLTVAAIAGAAPHDQRLALVAKYERFVGFAMETLSQSSEVLDLEKRFLPEVDPLAPSSKLSATAPLEELLLHLTSPLPSLQRYLHAARCLVECKCFGEAAEKELVDNFISLAFERGAQEGTLVLDQVSQQDVGSILKNMDDVTLPVNDNRVLIHSGRLTKRFRRGRHDRLMFVFSDALCYVEELSNGRYRVRGQILLEGGGATNNNNIGVVPPSSLTAELSTMTTPPPRTSTSAATNVADSQRRLSSAFLPPVVCSPSGVFVMDVEDNPSESISHAFNLVVPATGITYLFFTQDAVQKRAWLDVFSFAFQVSRRSKVIAEKQQQTGEGPSLVRNEVQTLPRTSRLERQRREDYRVQKRAARVRAAAIAAAAAVDRDSGAAAHSLTTPAGGGDVARRFRQRSFSAGSSTTMVGGGGRSSSPPPPSSALLLSATSHHRAESSGTLEATTPLLGAHASAGSSVAGSPAGFRNSFRGTTTSHQQGGNAAPPPDHNPAQSLRASVRRQASLRGSYTAAQWAVELSASAGHMRMRSNDLLDTPLLPPSVLPTTAQPTFSLPPPRRDNAVGGEQVLDAAKDTSSIAIPSMQLAEHGSPKSTPAAPPKVPLSFEEYGLKMPPPAHLRASMGCTPMGTSAADVLAAAIAAATAFFFF
ncbi:Hypothetical protein, putative [Bodo saltans]|uniref:DH domain-containing protein n=1 Tax=Bodo saltans TaxID=75058 RepID=A0A0S4JMV3_BODSA|nr:Hypothetical protein, putative [Bodo saltans]|eukprot:CUG89843.1 Hypothetical protein, putative [Bodo saltans]